VPSTKSCNMRPHARNTKTRSIWKRMLLPRSIVTIHIYNMRHHKSCLLLVLELILLVHERWLSGLMISLRKRTGRIVPPPWVTSPLVLQMIRLFLFIYQSDDLDQDLHPVQRVRYLTRLSGSHTAIPSGILLPRIMVSL
jgi:hypothetical protein